jgi:lipopolysaccharide/colanic/teichoic acid biosynthesis glycosyltransferase
VTIFETPYPYVSKLNYLYSHQISIGRDQYLIIKRIFDLFICLLAIPFLIIPVLLITLIIVIDSPGNPFFVQDRIGYRGRKFRIIKFRSLWINYDNQENRKFMEAYIKGDCIGNEEFDRVAKYKPLMRKDVTRVGRILRKTSLDELPQIINIIRNDMTLIGPRPNVTWEVEAYKSWHRERLNVLPGLTGLAQVVGRSDMTFDDILRSDIQYIKNQSMYLDFWILKRTFMVLLDRKGAG